MDLNNSEKIIDTKTENSQCPTCGGNLVFNPKCQKLYCANCHNEYDFDKLVLNGKHDLEQAFIDENSHKEWASQSKMCKCQNCGASIMIQGQQITTKCPYCGSDYVIDEETLPGLKPDSVVPFAFDEKTAAEYFKKGVKKIFLIPHAFKKAIPENKIRGIYIPSFGFDVDTSSRYSGVLIKNHTHTDSKGHTHTTQERISISGTKKVNFRDLTIESSAKICDKDIKALLPYDYKVNYEFTPDFLRGFSTEHYNDSVRNCYQLAKDEMKDTIKNQILSSYSYDRVESFHLDVSYSNESYLYRLLPIYCFEFTYKKKKYITFMNGQTGKIGTGYPKSYIAVISIVLFVIAIFVTFFLLSYFEVF
ncbi:MAG: hypothetical protein SO087_05010 [Candidatus Onthovivens sp.]|nr:hypothetical protein [Mollicutes bacterium]MDY4937536.1 hypothetical protein [Candidatus Onthovivens sp.]